MTLDEAIKMCNKISLEALSEIEELVGLSDHYNIKEWQAIRENHQQFAEWLIELKEAITLLKQAVEDFSRMDNHIYSCDRLCDDCPLSGERDHCLKWRYADEALALIGGESDD